MTDLSIIIVTYKGWERLVKCLSPLAAFAGSAYSKEVIIVDNTPDPCEISPIKNKYSSFRYIHNHVNGGYGYAVNTGANVATGNYLLVLNPDTVASEEAIDMMIRTAEEHPVFSVISCRQVNERGKETVVTGSFPEFRNLTGFMRMIFRKAPVIIENDFMFPDWISGSVMLFRREDFSKMCGFDEDFWMYFEDVDICRRAVNQGGRIALLTNTVIEHNHGGSSRTSRKTTALTKTEVIISRHIYISKHKQGLSRVIIQSFLVVNNLVTGLIMSVPGVILFFIPKLSVRTVIFGRLCRYYVSAVLYSTWLSPQSVNYRKEVHDYQEI
ncbi:MAG TPA: glycosyltransferase family 2 protein [Bacteroidales bacterium]|nr:glycosyltransferase family 2 protein [Bacteroidales bacterium]